MKSKHQNFHDPRYSMLLSGVSQIIKNEEGLKKGMISSHEKIDSLTRVISKRKKKNLFYRILIKILEWISRHKKGVFDDCMEILLEYMILKKAGADSAAEEKLGEIKYSQCDVAWVNSVIEWIETYAIKMEEPSYVNYQDMNDYEYTLPEENLKVGIIADWGTGEEEAENVIEHLFQQKPDLIFHLGDVYYSGTEEEYEQHYIGLIDAMREKYDTQVPVYNVPGNHDYYSGGHAFYKFLANTNTKSTYPTQEASYFTLNNSAWQLQGMDTGYYDRHVFEVGQDMTHLREKEAIWHKHHLDKGFGADKKIILLSHHQLFSRFINIGNQSHNPRLYECFKDHLDKLSCWYWGHEHLFELYKPFLGLNKGRCVGNSAVPIIYDEGRPYRTTAKYKGKSIKNLPEILPESVVDNNGDVYANGFALLKLNLDKTGTASYFSVLPGTSNAKLIFEEAL